MPRSHLVEEFASHLAAGVSEKNDSMLVPKVSGTCDCHVTDCHTHKQIPFLRSNDMFILLAFTWTYKCS